jgi:kumamolisin
VKSFGTSVDLSVPPFGSFGSSGGGVSTSFSLPAYQSNAGVPTSPDRPSFKGRDVPDVTGDGDPASGYNILVDRIVTSIGGTSAVAPLWAGLIARINQKLDGRVGFINPRIYALPPASGALRDISIRDNRCSFKGFHNIGYDAGPGWDACSGLGSPDGAALANLLTPPRSTAPRIAAADGRGSRRAD